MENWVAHPHQEFPGVLLTPTPTPPPPGLLVNTQSRAWGYGYSTTFLLCYLMYYIADDGQAIWRKYLILFLKIVAPSLEFCTLNTSYYHL